MSNRSLREVIEGQRLVSGTEQMSVREAARRMVEHRVGALPILREQVMVGIFTERDVLARVVVAGLDPDRTTVAQVMTHNPLSISIEAPLERALRMMRSHSIRHLPVLEGTLPVGVVTTRDALGEEWVRFEAEQDQEDQVAALLR
ncbi:cyclic nucleotide-binding/CBS domain-containing protein [Azovibrio restrictus]|uniref:CBS domain-containing protein n=1 Tax=Azovibrio restrictus TaxID=146938 RepID=UPI0026F2D2DF|nr:CBS domain-containing protein [Azovibrio restrictus]MDD3481412.1 CBS domain-containing protein [Azovibrio restrictus]